MRVVSIVCCYVNLQILDNKQQLVQLLFYSTHMYPYYSLKM